MKPRPSQSGFVLLLVLVLVLLAGTTLAGLAWRSMMGAIRSQQAAEELKRRWAVASCRETLLANAEDLLDKAERGKDKDGKPSQKYVNKPQAQLRVSCQLAGIDYELIFTDEQAKLNLNTILESGGMDTAQSAIRRLIAGRPGGLGTDAKVNLHVLNAAGRSAHGATTKAVVPRIGSYGQVFENATPQSLIGDRPASGLAGKLTCWGDGKVNLRRAAPEVIEQICDTVLRRDVAAALIDARNCDPYRKCSAILADLGTLDDKQRAKLAGCLSDKSNCHGLWVIARSQQRSWYSLAVCTGGGSSGGGDAQTQQAGAGDATTQAGSASRAASQPHVSMQCEFEW